MKTCAWLAWGPDAELQFCHELLCDLRQASSPFWAVITFTMINSTWGFRICVAQGSKELVPSQIPGPCHSESLTQWTEVETKKPRSYSTPR